MTLNPFGSNSPPLAVNGLTGFGFDTPPQATGLFILAKLAQQSDCAGIARDEALHGKIPDDLRVALGLSPQTSVFSPHTSVILWGSGTPRREFLYVDDLANALVFLATLDDASYDKLVEPSHCPIINIASGEDLTIRDLAETVAEVVGNQGRFVQDSTKPDGTMRKIMDISKICNLGWVPEIDFRRGIALAYEDYLASPKAERKGYGWL